MSKKVKTTKTKKPSRPSRKPSANARPDGEHHKNPVRQTLGRGALLETMILARFRAILPDMMNFDDLALADGSLKMHKADEPGWVLVRFELLPKTYHFLAVFVQKDLFPAERRGRRGRRRRERTASGSGVGFGG